jgi:hypothetical protein
MRRLLHSLTLAAALVACDDQGPAAPADIVIAPNLPRVPMGGTEQLTATVVDADGRAIERYPVTFRSSDAAVLTVSPGGLLRSVGPLGSSIISVTAADVTAEVEATVVPGPSTLLVTPDMLDLVVGGQEFLEVTVTDENGNVVRQPELVYRTDNPEVAQVSLEGYVTALHQGMAMITVSSGGLIGRVEVHVESHEH